MENPRAQDDGGSVHTAAGGAKNISVFCRLKPQSLSEEGPSSFAVEDAKTLRIRHPVAPNLPHDRGHKAGATKASLVFTYDRVYDETSSQTQIFEEVGKPLVEAVCDGINATVLAYGTTASGKTYTILGPRVAPASGKTYTISGPRMAPASKPQGVHTDAGSQRGGVQRETPLLGAHKFSTDESKIWECKKADLSAYSFQGKIGAERPEDGLLPRMIFYMFGCLERKAEMLGGRIVRAAAMEVYNDSIVDLATGRKGLRIQRPKAGHVSIVGLHQEVLLGPEAAMAFLGRVVDGRKTAATNVNAESSRSHFVFWLTLQAAGSFTAGSSTTARLSVVDLAGSERLFKTNTRGGNQVEGAMINKSLTCLGKVISCLASLNEPDREPAYGAPEGYGEVPCLTQQCKAPRFIPYRDSKLTRLLQDSLAGGSYTSIVLTCSQEATHLAENIPTLRFGQRARSVKIAPRVNAVASHGKHELQKDISRYQNYIRELASWGETAIIKLTDRTRSTTEKLCSSQNIPILRKTGGPSRRTGAKRASTSASGFVKDCDDDDRHAGVVDELLAGFPAPPTALQLDFTKDDVAMNIRLRLQHELVSDTRVEEIQADTHEPDSVPYLPIHGELAQRGAGDFRVTSLDALPHTVDRAGDPALPVRQRSTRSNSEEHDDSRSLLEKETMECCHAGPRQGSDTTGGSNRASLPSFTTLCCDIQPDNLKNRQAYSLPPHASPKANRTPASTASYSCEILQEQQDVTGPQREIALGQRQDDDGRPSYVDTLSHYSKTDPTVQPQESVTAAGRVHTMGRVIPPDAHHASPKVRSNSQLAPSLKFRAFWKAATSWVSHIKELKALVPGRAGRLDALRRATQVDDAIRFKQRLLL